MDNSSLFDSSRHISRDEFAYPDRIAAEVIREAIYTRETLGRPMYFTRSMGRDIHPNGDAVDPHSPAHSAFSLHKWGIDHAESLASGYIVSAPTQLCLALDWDAGARDHDELFEQYLILARATGWTGIGVYPFWRRPGFHTDLRSSIHPALNAHWLRDRDGVYRPLTWRNWRQYVIGADAKAAA